MNKEFVMRGKTDTGKTEVLNFSGYKQGYAYRLVEFDLYPATSIGDKTFEFVGSITAGKTAITPTDLDFNDEALIASTYLTSSSSTSYPVSYITSINDTFLITQNLILMVQETSGTDQPINWQCRFVAEKMSGPEEAVANYKQFTISD